MEYQDWKFDKRIVRRNLRRKLMTKDEHNAYLSTLPDAAAKSSPMWEEDRSGGAVDSTGARLRRGGEFSRYRDPDDD